MNTTADTRNQNHAEMIAGQTVSKLKQDMLTGRPGQGCHKCYSQEAAGIESLRDLYNLETAGFLDHSRLSEPSYENRTWYDLSLSNKCNQKCRICGLYNSTSWKKDADALSDLEWSHVNWKNMDSVLTDSSTAVSDILSSMQAATSAFKIELKGGEPLYMESSKQLLSGMIKLGLHEKTEELRIITNGTQHDADLISLLKMFPNINMAISVDATGKLHEYVRGTNMSWDECRRSWLEIAALPNITRLRISNTIYAYTIFDLANLREWVLREFGNKTSMADAMLDTPKYLHTKIVPQHLRDLAVSLLPPDYHMSAVIAAAPTPAEFYKTSDLDETVLLMRERFKTYTTRLDQLRDENLLDVVPELAEMMR